MPLTFDTGSARPALWKGLAVYEFTRWIAEDLHRMGKLCFANGVPYRFGFLCPWLDVLGTETDWLAEGAYSPAPHEQMRLWRTLSGGKPYLLLMNTDFDRFGPEIVEKYFQRSLFYGMYPSMFSHNAAENPYWENPRWYNRDRPLFQKYQPAIRRVAQAGWQPPHAGPRGPPRGPSGAIRPGPKRLPLLYPLERDGANSGGDAHRGSRKSRFAARPGGIGCSHGRAPRRERRGVGGSGSRPGAPKPWRFVRCHDLFPGRRSTARPCG